MKMHSPLYAACAAVVLSLFAQVAHAQANAVLDTKAPCEKPAYPRASLVNEEQGTVTLAFLISVDGSVVESKVEKTSGFKNLDKAAQKALSGCKFKPPMKDGKPVQDWAKLDYVWKLE